MRCVQTCRPKLFRERTGLRNIKSNCAFIRVRSITFLLALEGSYLLDCVKRVRPHPGPLPGGGDKSAASRQKHGAKLAWVRGFNARILRGILTPPLISDPLRLSERRTPIARPQRSAQRSFELRPQSR